MVVVVLPTRTLYNKLQVLPIITLCSALLDYLNFNVTYTDLIQINCWEISSLQ